MADNRVMYGFRWSTAANGGRPCPNGIEGWIDTAETFDVSGGTANCHLGAGDLVRRKSTGGFEMVDGNETTPEDAYGVVVNVGKYWDGSRMLARPTIPSDVAWGTILERQTLITVVPVDAGRWEVDCDENTTAATEEAYRALVGENVEHILSDFSVNNVARLGPELDISTHNTTALGWRIVGISKSQHNQDFTGDNVKLIVEANTAQLPWSSTTGV